jgi:hypothetical protein
LADFSPAQEQRAPLLELDLNMSAPRFTGAATILKDGVNMKRIAYVWFAGMILASMMVSASSAQNSGTQNSGTQGSGTPASATQGSDTQNSGTPASGTQGSTSWQQRSIPAEQPLGDYARAARKDKKTTAAKQFDNDNLPMNDTLSVVGNASAGDSQATAQGADNSQAANGQGTDKAEKKMPQVTPGQSAEDRQRVYEEWKEKIAKQKEQVDLLARELDVAQREYRLRAAAMYADVGNRMRNEATWDKEDADYKQKIAEKQKALDDAKHGIEDMQEEARKSGVPNSVRESAEQGPSDQQ